MGLGWDLWRNQEVSGQQFGEFAGGASGYDGVVGCVKGCCFQRQGLGERLGKAGKGLGGVGVREMAWG